MHRQLLKSLAPIIAGQLASLFTTNLETDKILTDRKLATARPVNYKGLKHDNANKRPARPTLICCKVMKRFMGESFLVHLVRDHFPNDAQYGFVANRSH